MFPKLLGTQNHRFPHQTRSMPTTQDFAGLLGSGRRLFDLSTIVITIKTRSEDEAQTTAADLDVPRRLNGWIATKSCVLWPHGIMIGKVMSDQWNQRILGYPISDKPIMLMHHSAVWAKKSYFEFHLEVSTVSNEITSAVAQNPSLAWSFAFVFLCVCVWLIWFWLIWFFVYLLDFFGSVWFLVWLILVVYGRLRYLIGLFYQ